jgi:hypothetical protein
MLMVRSIRSWVIEMNVDFTKVINHKAVVPGLLGVSVFSAGVAAGVVLDRFLGKSKPPVHIPAEPQQHPRLFDPDDPPMPERVVLTLEEAIAIQADTKAEDATILWSEVEPAVDGDGEPIVWADEYVVQTEAAEDYEPPVHIPEVMAEKTASEVIPVPFNVLDAAEPEEWNWDKEVQYRELHPDGPYQIHEDEYASGSANFHIQELLFYGVDQIVCEQLDPRSMMYDYATKLGDVKFGYGAHDEDIAYVRNPRHRTDYQITQMHDSYSESVMGIVVEDEAEQDELAHMDRPLRMRRME